MQLNLFSHRSRMLAWGLLLAALMTSGVLAGQVTYVVKRGDTLSGIASKYKLSVAALAERNGLSRNHHVKTGQRLIITTSENTTSVSPSTESTYVVKRGDTLFDIAKANNLSVIELAGCNGLDKNYQVKTGERLVLTSADKSSDAPAKTDATYVVKRGDTLFDLAKANNVSVDDLAKRNGFEKTYQLKTGERITLPSGGGGASSSAPEIAVPLAASSLPTSISSAIANASVSPGRWKYIVIHHSGVDEGTVKGMDRYHREVRHMENGLAYHFVIGNGHGMGNGTIEVGNRWKKQLDGGHLASLAQNKTSIGICLVGNFDKSPPTAAQLKSLTALVQSLMARCKISAGNVKTHQQINIIGTRCPGTKFPTKSFLAGLKG